MITPAAEISVNGKPVASIFNERLISVTVTDKEGVTSDTVSCDLNDGNPFAAIPQKGDTISVSLGYLETGVVFFGDYTADDPEVTCLPYGMSVNGKGANLRDALKQNKARHWDDKSVKDIVSEIAGDHGLTPVIDSAVGAYQYKWFGQEDESDIHVVERLARRHNALFSIKAGRLIFAEKGGGKSASGAALTAIVATPAIIVEGTCRTTFAHRYKYRKVKARTQDKKQAKLVEVEEDSHDEGTADYTLPEPFADEDEAKRAAKSKAKDLKSETIRTSVTVVGDPSIRAGAPFRYSGVRPELDDIEFIIETATHTISKGGYTTDIEAKLKPDDGSGGGSSTGTGTTGSTTTAPDGAVPAPGGSIPNSSQGGIGPA